MISSRGEGLHGRPEEDSDEDLSFLDRGPSAAQYLSNKRPRIEQLPVNPSSERLKPAQVSGVTQYWPTCKNKFLLSPLPLRSLSQWIVSKSAALMITDFKGPRSGCKAQKEGRASPGFSRPGCLRGWAATANTEAWEALRPATYAPQGTKLFYCDLHSSHRVCVQSNTIYVHHVYVVPCVPWQSLNLYSAFWV